MGLDEPWSHLFSLGQVEGGEGLEEVPLEPSLGVDPELGEVEPGEGVQGVPLHPGSAAVQIERLVHLT